MPIYEYQCATCGQFEVMQRITEEPLTRCETCGGPVAKIVSHSSFALKGGGWYKDLYSSAPKSSGSGSGGGNKSAA